MLYYIIICCIICYWWWHRSKRLWLYCTCTVDHKFLIFSLRFWEVVSLFVISFSEAQSRTTDNVLSTDQSSLPSPVNVTGGTSSGDTTLHFFVHEQGKYIQIGQCCVIVEMHVNDQTMERLKAQGTLEGQNHCPLFFNSF